MSYNNIIHRIRKKNFPISFSFALYVEHIHHSASTYSIRNHFIYSLSLTIFHNFYLIEIEWILGSRLSGHKTQSECFSSSIRSKCYVETECGIGIVNVNVRIDAVYLFSQQTSHSICHKTHIHTIPLSLSLSVGKIRDIQLDRMPDQSKIR